MAKIYDCNSIMIGIYIPCCSSNFYKFKHALILKLLKINVYTDVFGIYILKNIK